MLKWNRSGVTAVEFSVVFSVLILIIFAMLEFGRFQIVRHSANQAAYEAARLAMVPGANKSEAQARVAACLSPWGISSFSVNVNPSTITESTPYVTVEVSVPMAQNGWGISKFLGGNTIKGVSRLRTERTPMVQALSLPEPHPPPPLPPPPPPPPPPDDDAPPIL